MSELKVNKISPQSGTAFTLGDSGDTFTVPSGATLTVAGTLTQTGAQTFDGGVDIDNFNINGTTIALSSGDMTLDVAGDILLNADGGDIKFSDASVDLLSITNSSSDVVLKPLTDAKDIIFQQYDGTEVARIEDNATFNVSSAGKFAYAGTAVTATAAELNLLDGGTSVGGSITLADADGLVVNDSGTMKTIPASDVKTYAGGLTGVTTGSGNVTITDGDLIVASGHGISFAATGDGSSTMINELLDDYEEGTWTPTFSNYGGTDQTATGEYTKIGELIIAGGRIGTDGSSDSSVVAIAGLPYTISNSPAINGHGGLLINYTNSSQAMRAQTVNNTSYVEFVDNSGNTVNYNDFGANKEIRFTIIYKVA